VKDKIALKGEIMKFRFNQAWVHRDIAYKDGDTAELSRADVAMLLEAKAGELPSKTTDPGAPPQ
jgi:hypothetical protein